MTLAASAAAHFAPITSPPDDIPAISFALDQPVFIGVVTDALWEKFCTLFGLAELWADQSLRKNIQCVAARDRIMPIVRSLIGEMSSAEMIAKLDGSGLPFATIGRPQDLFDDSHLNHGGLEDVVLDSGTTLRLPTIPLQLDGKRIGARQQLPRPAHDSRTVPRKLDLEAGRIEHLFDKGTVGES